METGCGLPLFMDVSDREVSSYTATTKGITVEMVKDLMAEWIKYRFGTVKSLFGLYSPPLAA